MIRLYSTEKILHFSKIVLFLALLKVTVDFIAKLIGAEGAKTPAGGRGRGDPAGA
jgi:hypothetical protein